MYAPHGGRDFFFELDGAFVAQRRMFSEAIVEDFDILEGIAAGSSFIEEDLIADRGCFVSAVEGFLRGVVVAVTFGAHALRDAEGF